MALADARPHLSDAPLSRPVYGAVRLQTLVLLRWIAVAGQSATVMVVQFGLGFPLPLIACLAAIAALVILNLVLTLRFRLSRRARGAETFALTLFDITQLSLILGLTGGLANPFVLILVAPVVVGAATLPARLAMIPAAYATLCTAAMALWSLPLPGGEATGLSLPGFYIFGLWTALIIAIAFTGLTAWRASAEAAGTARALAATQAILAREQRLAAIGGIAAAAAHELGTPLATIQLVAKEMAHALPEGDALSDDAKLLVQQARRCRDILAQLSQRGEEGDDALNQADMKALLTEAAEPFHGLGAALSVAIETDSPLITVKRTPEILFGLGNFIENAVDFAKSQVRVTGAWTDKEITITIADDGPGFDPDVLAKLGEPYVSTREGADDAGGMGLGVFIAETLLERTGAAITFENGGKGGAVVRVVWRRDALEAPDASSLAPARTI